MNVASSDLCEQLYAVGGWYDTENAAAKLCIELLKQGILTKEGR